MKSAKFKVFFGVLAIAALTVAFSILLQDAALAQSPTASQRTKEAPLVPPEAPTTGINLRVSPVFLNLMTDPGEPVTASIKVTNNNNSDEYLQMKLARFVPVAEGNPTIADVEPTDAFARTISFSDPQFRLSPNETKTIRVTVDAPSDAALGYYYAIVINRIREQEATEQSVVSGAPAVPLLVEVRSPNAKRELQLVDFKTDMPVYEYLPTEFTLTFKNSGNIHSSPIGTIFIDLGSRKNVGLIPVNEGKGNLLPNSTRSFKAVWDDGFAVRVPKMENGKAAVNDKNQPVYETKYDFTKADRFRIGKYTARALVVYDNGERDVPLEAQVSFWVIPWKILLGALVILVFAFLGLKSTISANIKRFRKK